MWDKINKVDFKKTIGVNINKNMPIDKVLERISTVEKIDFSSEIDSMKAVIKLAEDNQSLFKKNLEMKESLKDIQNVLALSINVYNKTNSATLNIMDKIPTISGSPINSQIGLILTPLSNGLEETKKSVDRMSKMIEDVNKEITSNVETIRSESNSVKQTILEKVVEFSQNQL